MTLYKIYDRRTLKLVDTGIVKDYCVDFDYMANNASTLCMVKKSKGHKGDIVAITEGATLIALGCVTAIDNGDLKISFKHMKELFNDSVINVFKFTGVLNKRFEGVQGLQTILTLGFLNNTDHEMNLPIEFRLFGRENSVVWVDDGDTLNVVDFIDFLFDHYNIFLDFELDFINDRIICTINKNTTSGLVLKDNIRLSKPELDNNELPRENRAILFDKDRGTIRQTFFLLQDNTLTTNRNHARRILPPATRYVAWDEVDAIREGYTMQELAFSEIGGNLYGHCILYKLAKTQTMVEPRQFAYGDQIRIIYEGRSYDSIFTGLKFKKNDPFYTCIFGKARIDFTDRMKMHNNRRFAKRN